MSKEKQNNVPQPTSATDDNIIAAIGYLWLLFLVPLFLKKNSEYCQFHAKQGLVLFATSIILLVINIIPVLGWIICFFGHIALIILSALGFVNALQGKRWELPFLGQFTKKINL